MKTTYSLLTTGLLSFLLSSCASTTLINMQSKVPKNSEQLIGEYGFWKRDCTDRHFDIYIEQYPEGGDLRFEVGTLVIPDNPEVGAAGNCVGKYVQSKRLVYVPDEGFVGEDSVTFVVKSSVVFADQSYTVDIEVN